MAGICLSFQPQFFLNVPVDISLGGKFDSTELARTGYPVIPRGGGEIVKDVVAGLRTSKAVLGPRSGAFRRQPENRHYDEGDTITFTGSLGLFPS